VLLISGFEDLLVNTNSSSTLEILVNAAGKSRSTHIIVRTCSQSTQQQHSQQPRLSDAMTQHSRGMYVGLVISLQGCVCALAQ
jgi:hypothetical protein